MKRIKEAGLKIPVISLIVLIGVSTHIFFFTDGVAKEKSQELEVIHNLDWAIPLGTYEYIQPFRNKPGLFAVREENQIGVAGKTGDIIIPCMYDHIRTDGKEELISASLQGKNGYLDERGGVAIPFIYDETFDFCGEYALVSLEGRYQVIDASGEIVYENRENYRMYPTEKEGIFSFWKGKSLDEEWADDERKAYKGLIDVITETILVKPDTYQGIFHYSEGVWLTSLYPQESVNMPIYVFLDESFDEAFPGKVFHEAQPFSEGFAAVSLVQGAEDRENMPDAISVEWGYMDREGRMLESDLDLGNGDSFSNGLAGLYDSKSLFFINTSGDKVFEIRREGNFKFAKEAFQEGFAPVATKKSKSSFGYGMLRYSMPRSEGWGYVDKEGSFAVPPIFQDASLVTGGLAVVQYGGNYGVISVGSR
ncbi:MAG: WG repeat-containing protein [Eubacteriales bacterium]|nr:WG repeat-containing protein [Eubacteriales bacterium]